YPVLLLLVISGILQFWTIFLLPKFERIFHDMHMSLPEETEWTITLGRVTQSYAWLLALAVPALALLLVLLLASPGFRWYFPVVGHFYRGYVRSQILQALSFLFRANEPAPEALALLAESSYFVGGARRRLHAIRRRVEQGEPLADSL